MNITNTHIVKTWLAKAVSKEDTRPALMFGGIQKFAGYTYLVSADGYRLHAARHIPGKLRSIMPGTIGLVDIMGHGEIDWTGTKSPHFPDVSVILNEGPDHGKNPSAQIKINPRNLITSLKWAVNRTKDLKFVRLYTSAYHNDETEAYLKVTTGNGMWDSIDIPAMGAGIEYANGFSFAFKPKYMLDALWMWYYEKEVFITISERGMIFIDSPTVPHLAVIMAANVNGEYDQ
jgi:hypothetical protein